MITPSLSETLAPPRTTTKGCSGSWSRRSNASNSAMSNNPAADGRCSATPAVEACARWAEPNASSTKASARPASRPARSGSFLDSPRSNRVFSRRTTASPPLSPAWRRPPRDVGRDDHLEPSQLGQSGSDVRHRVVGIDAVGASEVTADEHPCTSLPGAWMVGTAARTRKSSVIVPSSSGTLRSARTRTVRPATSTSSMVGSRLMPLTLAAAAPLPIWPAHGGASPPSPRRRPP